MAAAALAFGDLISDTQSHATRNALARVRACSLCSCCSEGHQVIGFPHETRGLSMSSGTLDFLKLNEGEYLMSKMQQRIRSEYRKMFADEADADLCCCSRREA